VVRVGWVKLLTSLGENSAAGAQAREEFSADEEVGLGNYAVDADEETLVLGEFLFFLRQLVGANPAFVFQDVIQVLALEMVEDPAVQEIVAGVEVPGDLEIDQVRQAIVAEEDVLGFVRVHVGDVLAMEFLHQVLEMREETVGAGFVFFERSAIDVGVEEAGFTDLAE